MIDLAHLPSRRTEGWRWSDLRAAVDGQRLERKPETDARREVGRLAKDRGDAIAQLASHAGLVERRDIVGRGEEIVAPRTALQFEELILAPHADLVRVIVQEACNEPWLLSTRVILHEGARFRQFILAEGARLARIETHVDVQGEGARVELNGVYLAGAERHVDLTSIVNHQVANATTKQLIKGVARKGGRGVFQGKIEVARYAQKTDARQHHAGLMLEEGAEIFAKPELMIFADDVACAHGNTIGALDAQALFYLRSRGVPEREARALLVEAFLGEAVPDWLPSAMSEEAFGRIRTWLGGAA